MVLAFDPGVTTGVAIISDEGGVVWTAAITDFDDLTATAKNCKEYYPFASTVVEKGPEWGGHNRQTIEEIEHMLTSIFPATAWATPSQWKGHPASKKVISLLKGKTQHEKDAAGLGCWYNSFRRNRANKGTEGAQRDAS